MTGNAGHRARAGRFARRAGALLPWMRPALLVLLAAAVLRAGTLRTEPAQGREAGLAGDTAASEPVWFLDCGFPRQCRLVSDGGEWVVISDESGSRLLEIAFDGPLFLPDAPRLALPGDGAVRVEGTVLRGAPAFPATFAFPGTPTPTPPPGSTPTPTPTPRETPTKTHY